MTTLADDHVVDGTTATDNADGSGPATSSGPVDRLLTTGWWPAIVFSFGALIGAGPISDNSFLTHVATGRLILAKGVPTADPYSFVASGRPWVVQSWLASWVLAVADRVGGFALIRGLVALVTGLLVLCIWQLTAPAKQLAGRLALCGLSVIAGLHYWSERPQTLAFLLAAVVLLILSADRPTWLIAPLAALWINVHGSFPLLAALIGGWWIVTSIEQRTVRRQEVVAGGWALFGITAGALVSPFGTGLIEFPFRMVGRTEVLQYILEWRSPRVSDSSTWFAALLALVTLAVLARDRRWARRGRHRVRGCRGVERTQRAVRCADAGGPRRAVVGVDRHAAPGGSAAAARAAPWFWHRRCPRRGGHPGDPGCGSVAVSGVRHLLGRPGRPAQRAG